MINGYNIGRSGLFFGTAMVSFGWVTSGYAQDQKSLYFSSPQNNLEIGAPASPTKAFEQPQNEDRQALEEIVVTAQKREQSLQDVPIAVTALSAQSIENNRVFNVQDLNGLAPNLTIRPASGGTALPSFTMRGIVSYGVVPGSDKQVSINLDGVYLSTSRGSVFELPDIERIEVLRGPQGTLFGRNATAGAINIIMRNPTGEFGARQSLTVGNYDQLRLRTTVDLPAVGPFSAYVTYVHNERRGDMKNLGAGTMWDRTGPDTGVGVQRSPKTLGDKNVESWFAALRFAPSSDFNMTYKFDHTEDHYTPEGVAPIFIVPSGGAGGALLDTIVKTQPTPVTFFPDAKRPTTVNNWWSVPGMLRASGHTLTSELRLNGSLSVKNVAAYRKSFVNIGTGQLGGIGGLVVTPAAAALMPSLQAVVGQRFVDTGNNTQHLSKQWSNELQVNYDSDFVTLTLGGIYFHSNDRSGTPPGIRTTANLTTYPASGDVPLGTTQVSYNKTTSIAGYGQAELHATDQIDIVASGRITQDKKSGRFVSGGTFVSSVPGCPPVTNPQGQCRTQGALVNLLVAPFTYKNSEPIFSLGANFHPNRDILAYVKYSTGYVSGGAISNVAFEPEKVRSWEAGLKADFFNRKLRTNLALFHATYRNVQTAQSGRLVERPDLGTLIVTLGNLKAKGFELETTAILGDGLMLGGSLGYTDIRTSNLSALILSSSGITSGEAGYRYSGVPKWTSNLWAQYETRPLFGNATGFFRIDANWRSKLRLDSNIQRTATMPVFRALEFSPSAWVVNARAALRGMEIGGVETEFALWSRNLTNDKSPNYASIAPYSGAAGFQQARTYGLDLTIKF